jgi:methionyl-tRNA formyltransferase
LKKLILNASKKMPNPSFVFFGTSSFAVTILTELEKGGLLPELIITQEDKPKGRHLVLTPPLTKEWAEMRDIPVLQPKKLDSDIENALQARPYDLFIVASYGKIIPEAFLSIPKHQTLNVHPSLLPKLRGPAPIQGAILSEEKTGVTIMRLDALMDHGPVVAQKEIATSEWPPYASELETLLGHKGGELLRDTIPLWIEGSIPEKPQDESEATYIKKIQKEDAEISLTDDAETNLRKIRAYDIWPKAFTFYPTSEGSVRLIITRARIEEGALVLERVIPAGKKEMDFKDFERGLR